LAQPFALGVKKGVLEVQALQVGGATSSGSLPHWRRFLLRDVSELQVTEQVFRLAELVPVTDFDSLVAVYG